MSFQYVHTSSKRGLEPGKSGFCCVARDKDIPPDLIQELERQSRFYQSSNSGEPAILRYRIAALRSGVFHILSRIQDCGADYSKRNNHIAHHLAFAADEIASLPNPATLLLDWKGWRRIWDDPPRVFDQAEAFDIEDVTSRWTSGDAFGNFPAATDTGVPLRRAFEVSAGEEHAFIEHIRGSLKELRLKDQWQYSFTNSILPTEQPGDYVWYGVWNEQALPFEVNYDPLRLVAAPQEPDPGAEEELAEGGDAPPEAPEPDNRPQAPKVEIPEAFDRKKRRRPKRKFGRRELSRSLNLSMAVAALLCILVPLFYYWRNQEDVETLIKEKRGLETSVQPNRIEQARSEWNAFAQAGYPAEQVESLWNAAANIARTGDTTPLQILETLQALRSEVSGSLPNPLPLPPELVASAASEQTARLALDPVGYPPSSTLVLLPAELADALLALAAEAPDAFHRLDLPGAATFAPDRFVAALRDWGETVLQTRFALEAETREAIDRFEASKQALMQNQTYAPLLRVHTLFGLPESASYIAFDNAGLLLPQESDSYSEYAIERFRRYALNHLDGFRNAARLQASLSELGHASFETPYDAMAAIDRIQQLAQPEELLLRREWEAIQRSWQETFIRSDLMEQTILSYTIEALERTRAELAQQQAAFDPSHLSLLAEAEAFASQIAAVASRALSAARSKEWVVFEKQSAKASNETR